MRCIATIQINWVGELLDTTFKLFGKYGTWLSIKKNKWYFIIHIICCCYWVVIDIYRNLWSQALFTIPTIVMLAYGFYRWTKEEKNQEPPAHP